MRAASRAVSLLKSPTISHNTGHRSRSLRHRRARIARRLANGSEREQTQAVERRAFDTQTRERLRRVCEVCERPHAAALAQHATLRNRTQRAPHRLNVVHRLHGFDARASHRRLRRAADERAEFIVLKRGEGLVVHKLIILERWSADVLYAFDAFNAATKNAEVSCHSRVKSALD
jgi:hypothetical protein